MLVVAGVISQEIPKFNQSDPTAGWIATLERTPATAEWIENLAFELSERTGKIMLLIWAKIPGYYFIDYKYTLIF